MTGISGYPGISKNMDLSPFWVTPFVLILASIAVVPLINSHFWEKNLWWISLFVFTAPMMTALLFFLGDDIRHLTYEKIGEYISFILLLGTLYVISGGIFISGTLTGSPTQNTLFLFTGSLIASLIGTTGASMLLIRPLIRANRWRKNKKYIIVFFIFLVSNVGGILTPLGDPPLFLGYLQGVPFEWTLQLFPQWAITAGILLVIFYFVDLTFYHKESPQKLKTEEKIEGSPLLQIKSKIDDLLGELDLKTILSGKQIRLSLLRRIRETLSFASLELEKASATAVTEPIAFMGKQNFFLLAGVVTVIYMQGNLRQRFPEFWPAFGPQEVLMFLLAVASLVITPLKSKIRVENDFNFGPIKEVALIFAAIFTTMVPALYILEHHGASLGVREDWQFFWASGILSSFLDNAPTYMTFLSLGKSLGLPNDLGFVLRDGGSVTSGILTAISCGSVFMGANSYIGNGPNFMVRSIAESQGIKMPSFFGYMLYSIAILIPIFILLTFIFFI